MKIAVLDDDKTQLQLVEQALLGGRNGWSETPLCSFFESGEALLAAVKSEPFDVVILDRHLPDMSGDVILQWLRQFGMARFSVYTSVIMLTSARSEEDALYGFQLGADDYLTKPFSPLLLVEKIKRLLEARKSILNLSAPPVTTKAVRRFNVVDTKSVPLVVLEGYRFNAFERSVSFGDARLEILTGLEFDLALLFFANVGMALSRAEIFGHAWISPKSTPRSLDTHVHRLRVKLQLLPENGFVLRTVYGYGYCLDRQILATAGADSLSVGSD